jgi:hypothetical protein
LAAYQAAEMDFHQILQVRLVAEIVANKKNCMLLASDFDIGFL